jgi:hypothetical protein
MVTGIAIAIIAVANLCRLFVFKLPVPELLKIRDDSDGDQVQTIDAQ